MCVGDSRGGGNLHDARKGMLKRALFVRAYFDLLTWPGIQVERLAGTDVVAPWTYPGFSLHDELGLLVEAGLMPLEALRTATINPAEFFGMKDVGAIAPGMKANLILLDADPLENIANTKKISSVIMRGKLYTRVQLDDLLKTS